MMQPYVREPILTLTVGLYKQPKTDHDQDRRGGREAPVGHAQAWYYPADTTIVLWESFFDERFHSHPLPTDTNTHNLWQAFEHWLIKTFPNATTLATPFNDPIAGSIEEYQAFLRKLGYSPITEAVFGKRVR
jgi:hypothetical protein